MKKVGGCVPAPHQHPRGGKYGATASALRAGKLISDVCSVRCELNKLATALRNENHLYLSDLTLLMVLRATSAPRLFIKVHTAK